MGIDFTKNVFALHGVNKAGKPELVRPVVPRDKLHELVASLPPCVVGMEACSGALHWARLFQASGHVVRLIDPKFVTPYRMSSKLGKNDAADAAAICEAIQRPHMRFVTVKDMEQQSRLMVHRARQGFVEQRTATLNRIRGLLSEFGIVLPLKAATVRRRACEWLEELSGYANTVIGDLLSEVKRIGCAGLSAHQHGEGSHRVNADLRHWLMPRAIGRRGSADTVFNPLNSLD